METYNISEAKKSIYNFVKNGYTEFCPHCISGIETTKDGTKYCPNEMCLNEETEEIKDGIYKIMDAHASDYEPWYGTIEDTVSYLDEQKNEIPGYNKKDGFIKNLERYGLTFEIVK